MRTLGLAVIFAFGALAACSDGLSQFDKAVLEPPVELKPGNYRIRLGGSTVIELKSGSRTDDICLDKLGAAGLPLDPLGWTVAEWDSCWNKQDPPGGNAIRGARLCEQQKVPLRARYSGTHTADSFEITGMVSRGSGETESVMQLGSGEFSISGERTGDCQGQAFADD